PRPSHEKHRDGGCVHDQQVGDLGWIKIAEYTNAAANDGIARFRRIGESEARLPHHALQAVEGLALAGQDRLIVRRVLVVTDRVEAAVELRKAVLQAGQVTI